MMSNLFWKFQILRFSRRATKLEPDPGVRRTIEREIVRTAKELRGERPQFHLDPAFPVVIDRHDAVEGRICAILQKLDGLKYVTGIRFEEGIEKKVLALYVKMGTRFTLRWIPQRRRTIVRFINEQVGFGLFAATCIASGKIVCEYAGYVCRYESIADHAYSYAYMVEEPNDLGLTLIVDSLQEGNDSRFINHSPQSNLLSSCEFYNGHSHILLRSRRDIRAGEQLFLDYGKDYWSAAGKDPQQLT
jgi:uncharacterized protein